MAAPVRVDDEIEVSIESLAYGGNGVGRLNGFVVFVRRGLPGDTVKARITKVKRNHAEALATEVVKPGPKHVDAPCAHYPECGGCRFQDLAYDEQLAAEGTLGRGLVPAAGRPCRPAARADRARRGALRLPQQDGVLVHAARGRPDARPPSGRALGRGARDRQVLADDRPRQRDPQRRPRLGARGAAPGLRPGDAGRLPTAPRRPRGHQHGPGTRAARDGGRASASSATTSWTCCGSSPRCARSTGP